MVGSSKYTEPPTRLLGFLLLAEYIPLASRDQRLLTNREDNEMAIAGHNLGITSESPCHEDREAMEGKTGTPGLITLEPQV